MISKQTPIRQTPTEWMYTTKVTEEPSTIHINYIYIVSYKALPCKNIKQFEKENQRLIYIYHTKTKKKL